MSKERPAGKDGKHFYFKPGELIPGDGLIKLTAGWYLVMAKHASASTLPAGKTVGTIFHTVADLITPAEGDNVIPLEAAVIDGFLVLERSSGAAYVAGYDYLQNQFKIKDAFFGKDGYVIDATGWVCIGRMKNDSTESTTSAILYERAVDMTTVLRTVFSEVIFGKADVTQAEFDAILQYTQTQFFNRLAVNALFVNDLVGNTAFIDSLITDDAFIQDAK